MPKSKFGGEKLDFPHKRSRPWRLKADKGFSAKGDNARAVIEARVRKQMNRGDRGKFSDGQ
ncbi:MAG: hypothetical protein Q7S24_00945 [bacterium]|nr:hypothetical protein [bacterium]